MPLEHFKYTIHRELIEDFEKAFKSFEESVTEKFYNNNPNLCLTFFNRRLKDQFYYSDEHHHEVRLLMHSVEDKIVLRSDHTIPGKTLQINNPYIIQYIKNGFEKYSGKKEHLLEGIGTFDELAGKEDIYPLFKLFLENFKPIRNAGAGISGCKGHYYVKEEQSWKEIYDRIPNRRIIKTN